MHRFRFAALAAVAVFGFASVACAADMPVKAPVAPVVAAPSWTGFYVGIHVGYAFANDNYILDPALAGFVGISSTNMFGSRGFSSGVLGGYNLLVSPRWLAGVEADWSWQDIATQFSSSLPGLDASMVAKQKWAASLRGRVGYLVTPETLVYGTAGWAWSKIDETVNFFGTEIDSSGNVNGPQVGAGMETMVAVNWRARLEYLHTFYSAASVDPTVTGVSGIKPSVGLARLAAIYQFGGAQNVTSPWPERAATTPTWTGIYVGASIGGAVGYGNLSITGVAAVNGVGLAGPMPSAFVGYNYQFAPRWLIGAEAEIAPSICSTDLKLGWIGAVRGRFGYLAAPDTLLYGSAGWIGTAVDDISSNGVLLIPGQHINGVQIGGGIESAFNNQWSVRLDYQYAIMQKLDIMVPSNPPPPIPATVTPRGHTGRIAIVRRFDGG